MDEAKQSEPSGREGGGRCCVFLSSRHHEGSRGDKSNRHWPWCQQQLLTIDAIESENKKMNSSAQKTLERIGINFACFTKEFETVPPMKEFFEREANKTLKNGLKKRLFWRL